MRKITLCILQLLFFCGVFINSTNAQQNRWWKNSLQTASTNLKINDQYVTFHIDNQLLENQLKIIGDGNYALVKDVLVSFPNDSGTSDEYVVSKTSVLHPKLAAKYPTINTYVGYLKNNPAQVIRFSYNSLTGLQGSIYSPDTVTKIIKSLNRSSIGIYKSKSEEVSSDFNCLTNEISANRKTSEGFQQKNANDGNLRRYRLALSVSGQYSQYFLDGTEQDDTERKTKIMAAMVSSINRVNGIFERDFNITMQIIPQSDDLIYLDPSSDPYTTGDSLNAQLQNAIDSHVNIGAANYDVGHLFHKEESVYGNAGCIACVCIDGSKGSAFTTHNLPDSDHFNMIVAHEFGHQFGGYHVQSSSFCRSGFNSEVEPGSGSTIMGYAGICPTNVQNQPDDYFNYVDIRDIAIWTINNSNCAEIIPTDNTAPVVDAGSDYTIPALTPFILDGSATDVDSDNVLTYCWEQNNPENPLSSTSPQSNWVYGPLFRSLPPSLSSKRYLPKLDDILVGNLNPTWEVLPSVNRTMRFELTVRDNVPIGGQSNSDDILLSVDENAGPFVVTSQNTSEVWNVGEQVTVTWDVANTNQGSINAQNVDIMLSVDGGYTYPFVLQDDISNDGSATFVLPNVESTSTARIMVKAADNIFFAINQVDFITRVSEFTIVTDTDVNKVCKPNNSTYSFNYFTYLDFNEEVTFSTINLPNEAQAVFNPASISGSQLNGTPIEVTITGVENLEIGQYEFMVQGDSPSGIQKNTELTLQVFDNAIAPSALVSPETDEVGFDMDSPFQWTADINATQYIIQIANDIDFNTIVESAEVSENSYLAKALLTDSAYFWRIRNINDCDGSEFSVANSFTTKCPNPENFRSISVGSNFVELSWNDINATEWEIEYGLSDFQIGNGTILSVSSFPYQIMGLSSLTSYDFYLRSNCTIGGNGAEIGPLSVSTLEDFCDGDRFYDSGGPDGNYADNENSTTVISPSSPGERVRVTFNNFLLESCCDRLSIFDGPDTSFPSLGTYTFASPGQITSTHESGSLTFLFTSDGSVTRAGWDASVVCEPKPNCDSPTDFVTDMVDATSASFSWNSDGDSSSWNLEYGLQNFQEGTGTVVNSDQTTFTITELSPVTSYQVYIRANCTAGGVSDVLGPFTFQTLCDVVSAPFLESFDEFNTTPQCWTESGSESWNYNTFANYDAASAGDRNNSGNTSYAWITGSFPNGENQISTLSTPLIDVSNLTAPSVQFSVFSKNTIDNSYNTLEVEMYDGADWNVVLQLQESTGGWRDVVVDLADYTITGPIQMRYTVTENSTGNPAYNDILIDEIKIDELPSCPNPYNIQASNIRGRTAEISWTVAGNEGNWELQYGLQGFTPANATSEFVTTTSFEINDLEPLTSYDVYLRALCGIGDNSELIGPITFRTDCDSFQAPFQESFASFGRPQCWQESQTNWTYGIYFDNNIQRNVPDRNPERGTNYARKYNDFNGFSAPSYLTSPFIDISGIAIPSIQFSLNSNEIINGNYNDLIVEFFDGENWNRILTFADKTDGWKDFYFDISSYTITEDIRIRFGITDNPNSSTYNYILIDEIKVGELPSCFTPNALNVENVEADSAEISWLAVGNETDWQLEYGPEGFTIGTGTRIDTQNNPENLTGLQSNTSYDVYVRAACDTNDFSEWSLRTTFETPANFCNGDHFYDSGGAFGNYTNSENETTVIVPSDANDRIRVLFESFVTESCCDQLRIYDGPDASVPFIGVYQGTNSPGEIRSTHETGALTFVFRSDGSVVGSGWDAAVFCEPKPNCEAPENIVFDQEDFGQVSMEWTSNAIENAWEIEYGLAGFTPGSGSTVTTSSNPYVLTNLSSDTAYDVYIKTACVDGGFSDLAGPFSFRTLVSCPEPKNLQVELITSNEAQVTFEQGLNEILWEFEYGPRGFVIGNGTRTQGDATSWNITDLTPDFNYDLYLRAVCADNDFSGWIGPVNFTTLVSCPSPTNLIANVTNESVSLEWDANGGNEQQWEVEYGLSSFTQGSGTLIQSDTNSLEILNLQAATTYNAYVRAFCDNDDSSTWLGPVIFRTSCNAISDNSSEYIRNGSFECGDLGFWESTGPGGNSGCRMNFTVLENSNSVCVIVPEITPTDGDFAAFTAFDGNAGDTFVLEQNVRLPVDMTAVASATLSFDFKVVYQVTYGTPQAERTLTATLYDNSNNLITTLAEESFGIDPATGSIDTTFSTDVLDALLSYGGQEIKLRFEAHVPDSSTGPAKALIDNVSFIIEDNVLSTTTVVSKKELLITPNPNKGNFLVSYKGNAKFNKLIIQDITGKLIQEIDLSDLNQSKEISLFKPEAGIYFARIVTKKGEIINKRILVE